MHCILGMLRRYKLSYPLRKYSLTSTKGHLSTTATFFCPQGGRCGEVQLYLTNGFFKEHSVIETIKRAHFEVIWSTT